MGTSTITSKGQITVPADVRSGLHVGPGDRLEFVKVGEGRYEVIAASQEVTRLRGMIKSKKIVTIEEMDAAIRSKAGRT